MLDEAYPGAFAFGGEDDGVVGDGGGAVVAFWLGGSGLSGCGEASLRARKGGRLVLRDMAVEFRA